MNLAILALGAVLLGAADLPSETEFGMPSRDLGKAAGHCRANEPGPAALTDGLAQLHRIVMNWSRAHG